MLDSGVCLHLTELQYGERPFLYADTPHIDFVGVRASSAAWTKENLINLGIYGAPEAKYICWCDTDIFFEKTHSWASETVHALQLYKWVQPWTQAIDRGPNGEILNDNRAFRSFCYQYELDAPLVPDGHGWKTHHKDPDCKCVCHCAESPPYGPIDCKCKCREQGPHHPYPHPGYAHATTREVLDYAGGLFELGGMGASDHAMSLALVGKARSSAPKDVNISYVEHLCRWQDRIRHAVHGRIGYVNNVINHKFHGAKGDRQYLGRWEMFLRHGFDPDTDLKRNSYGVLEWVSNKPELEREWMLYLRSRNEDRNSAD